MLSPVSQASDYGRDRPAPRARKRVSLTVDFDLLFVTTIFLIALFIRQLPGIGPALFLLAPVVYAVVKPERLGALTRCLPILSLGFFALLSVSWSQAPAQTTYFGLQYFVTILIACQIGSSISERNLLLGMFIAFFVFGCANLQAGIQDGLVTLSGFYDHPAFTGLMAGKNTQADISALGIMISLTTLIDSLRNRQRMLVVASLVLIAVNVLLVANSQSTGAVVASLVGAAIIFVCAASRTFPIQARTMVFAVVVIAALAALATQHLWYDSLLNQVMEISGKDSTLTGRTYIWERARVAIAQAPLLGTGFSGYWIEGNLEAEAIWRALAIPGKSGFNFHNTYYEIRVHLGLVGVVLFAGVFLPLLARTTIHLVRLPSAITVLFTAIWLYEISRMNFESIGLGLFHYTTFILFGALAWATRPFGIDMGPVMRKTDKRPTKWRSV